MGGGTTDDLQLGTGTDGRFSLVVFCRGLHCPICRKQLAEIDKRIEDLKAAGVGRVVAVSAETQDRSTRIVDEWRLANLPVAYGVGEESARSWGLNLSHGIKNGEPDLFNEPGIFILDEDGRCSGPAPQPCPSAGRPWTM